MKALKRLAVSTMLAAMLLAGCAGKEAGEKIEQANALINEEKYEDAIAQYQQVVSTGRRLQEAYRGMGIAYLKLDMYEEAETEFKYALLECSGKIGEMEQDISCYLADAQLRNGDIEDAIETYSNLIQVKDKDADLYFMRGVAYLKNGQLQEALEGFEKKIEEEPKNFDTYYQVCLLLKEAGETERMKEYADRGLSVEGGENKEYYFGVMSFLNGDYENAITYLSTQEAHKKADCYMYLGEAYEKTGDFEKSFAAYQAYMEQTEDVNPQIYASMGEYYMEQENYEQAQNCFQKGLEIANGEEKKRLMFGEASAYEYLLDFDSAREKWEAYLEEYPEDETAQREYRFLQTDGDS